MRMSFDMRKPRVARRGPWPGIAVLALALVLAALWPGPAEAARDLYRVRGVVADATAADAVAARAMAIEQGERQGLEQLLQRLTRPADRSSLPKVATLPLGRYVRSFEISNEQVAPTRYAATLNVTYNPAQVQSLLAGAGVAAVTRPSPTILLLPAVRRGGRLDLWSDDNPWRAAWAQPPLEDSALDLVLPLGDLEDVASLRAEDVEADDAAAVAPIAQRYGAREVVVAILDGLVPGATEPPASMTIELRHLDPQPEAVATAPAEAPAPDIQTFEPAPGSTMEGALGAAALRVVADLDATWKQQVLVQSGPTESLVVEVPLADLAGWVHIRRGLESLSVVRHVRVDALERAKAEVTIEYVGELQQLENAVAGIGLYLAQESDAWRLLPAGDPLDRATPSPATGTAL
jgi:hypothetical protein